MLRSPEEIKKLLQLEKEKNAKRLQQEKAKKAQIKAQERQRKQEHKKHMLKLEKAQQQALNKPQRVVTSIAIYHTKYIEKFPSDEDLYQTVEELQEWERTHWPCINWTLWHQLCSKTPLNTPL